MKLFTRRSMNRADWAWLMAAVVVGLFLGGFALLVDMSGGGPRQVTTFNYDTGKWEERTAPAYTKRLTIETNGDIQKMMQAVHEIDPDSFTLPSRAHSGLSPDEYAPELLGAVLGTVMFSFLFRIVIKICGRILGATTDEVEIVRDPSAASGQAGLRSG